MTAEDHEVQRVRELGSEMLGASVKHVTRLAGSVANRDYELRIDGRPPVIMKLGPADELARELWTLERLTELGLAVPSLVAYAFTSNARGGPALIVSLVEGAADEDPAVAKAAGAMMRRVHTVRLPGYGSLVCDNGSWRGEHNSWTQALAASVIAVPDLVSAGILPLGLAQQAVRVATGPLVAYAGGGVLLHHDLKAAHVFGASGGLTGVIDWGDASVGDPLMDVARMSMTPSMIGPFLDGYGPPKTDRLEARLAAYRISWNLDALGYEYRAGGDWFDVYRSRVAADVGWLSSLTDATRE